MGKINNTRSESKSDRKFDKKVQFYSKVKDSVSSLSAQKSIAKKKSRQQRRQSKKLKAYNLSHLLDSLPEFEASQKPASQDSFKVTCKSRKKILLEEEERQSKVRNHPDFQSDPVSAIRQHLLRTQPAAEEQPKIKKANKNGSKKKKNKSKASAGVQSMDM
ncbi:hypothetical protein TanjilG_18367 [Lupinus angustifolius]|uniref:Ribosome biogenesis protein slx9-like n=1 Tax=Lupinus angustifolius TaxID=3871 RepID=A0A1J7I2C6_LUPAN|nr:PREDICTED: ribosome biogenesis protein slx9-like isoform X1 [Lupinus angustifolius]OIW06979.1 hypothetical protein TanjilG_18367 [Lupinus angustifolius]